MIRRLIILLLIVGCEEPEKGCLHDCEGTCNGDAREDNCGVCDSDSTNDGVTLWGICYSIENTTELNLHHTQLTGAIPPEIGNLINLTHLWLAGNQLTGSIPVEIGNLSNLTWLSLSTNQLTGSIPVEIGNLSNLTYLSLSFNQLTGSIPFEIGNLTNLTTLHLSHNQFTSIPESICQIYPNLIPSTFFINNICGELPSCLTVDDIGTQDCP